MRHLAPLLALALVPAAACVCNVETNSSSTARPHDKPKPNEPKPNEPKPNEPKPNDPRPVQPDQPEQGDPVDPPRDPIADAKPPRPPAGVNECPQPLDQKPERASEAARPKQWPLSKKQYIYLDHGEVLEGKCIEGTCTAGPIISPTPPSSPIVFDDALKMVLHGAYYLGGNAGSGGGDWKFAVVELPYEFREFTIESAAADGTVTLDYRGLELVLAPGQRWECEHHSLAARATYTVALTRRVHLENLGIKDKSDRKPR